MENPADGHSQGNVDALIVGKEGQIFVRNVRRPTDARPAARHMPDRVQKGTQGVDDGPATGRLRGTGVCQEDLTLTFHHNRHQTTRISSAGTAAFPSWRRRHEAGGAP